MANHNQQTYWVTGASSGIGKALCCQLAEQGHHLVISSRSTEALNELAELYPNLMTVLACDISDRESMRRIFSDNLPHLEALDGIFLCAGICEYIDLPEFNLDAFYQAIAVNYLGTVNSCAAAVPLLEKRGLKGCDKKPFIVGLCSMSSYIGFPRAEAYGASKAAMAYFLDSLRADIGDRVDVITSYLGFVKTPMTAANDFPMPFIVSDQQAAADILAKLPKRPLRMVFPRRLHISLTLLSMMQRLWYKNIVPRLRRKPGVVG
tara:strand:- start:575 stop:1363 length:789 start_codon:yes stop_codon:yes gene_type:complete